MKKLFQDFDAVDTATWNAKIVKDLKGADYDEKLLSNTPEGIVIKPFYNSDDLQKHQSLSNYRKDNDWDICQEIIVKDSKKANREALECLNKGATALVFFIPSDCDPTILLKDILIEHIGTHYVVNGHPEAFYKKLEKLIDARALNPKTIRGSIGFDPLCKLAASGHFFSNENDDLAAFNALCKQNNTGLHCFAVNAALYHNAGATASEELGIAMAHAHEYVHHDNENAKRPLFIKFAVGSNYFMEIAKLRASRKLWNLIIGEYQTETTLHIHCETAWRNKTVFDPYVNMLRTTTEAMSAVMGSCDSLSVKAFDNCYKHSNDFGERIARNQQLILKGESYTDKVNDPAAGSFYVENLSHELAEKALDIFKKIEAKGGFLAALKSGYIQEMIAKSAKIQEEAFDKGERVLLGSNIYPNANERMTDKMEHDHAFYKASESENLVLPIPVKRLSEVYEQERLKAE